MRAAGRPAPRRLGGQRACAVLAGRRHWRYGEGAYKQRALDHVARFCATLPPPATEGAPAPESKRPAVRAGKPWLDDLGDIEDSEEES